MRHTLERTGTTYAVRSEEIMFIGRATPDRWPFAELYWLWKQAGGSIDANLATHQRLSLKPAVHRLPRLVIMPRPQHACADTRGHFAHRVVMHSEHKLTGTGEA